MLTILIAQKPLSGVILCCTNINTEERHNLATAALEMGASHRYDLTADVTHLLVGSIDSQKYKYVARERPDVKVILHTWVEAVRSIWMEGHECTEVDISTLEQKHKVPPIWNLQVCLTGFEELDKREEIKSKIERGGANYHPDLTKAVSHLVTKTVHGKKYEAARKWRILCVSEKWLADSLERGMALDETLYDPILPPEEQGIGAWRRDLPDEQTPSKKKRKLESRSDSGTDGKRKLRRTMSAKLKSNSDSLWADIGTGSAPKAPTDGFAENVDESTILSRQSTEASANHPVEPAATGTTLQASTVPSLRKEGIFAGVAVYIFGFPPARLQILSTHLGANGAVIPTAWADEDIIDGFHVDDKIVMIPHDLPIAQYPPMSPQLLKLPRVTEFWVESCLYQKSIVDPMQDRFTQPFRNQHVEGLAGLIIAATGFKDIDLLHLAKTIKMTGAIFDEFVRPETSLLISRPTDSHSDKLKYAWEIETPVVELGWLWACIDSGRSQSYDDFAVKPPTEFHAQQNRLLRGNGIKIDRTVFTKEGLKARSGQRQPHSNRDDTSPADPSKPSTKPSSRPLRQIMQKELNKPLSSPPKQAAAPKARGREPFMEDDDETASENTDPSQRQGQSTLNDAQAAELLDLLVGPISESSCAPDQSGPTTMPPMQPPSKSRDPSAPAVRPTELNSSIEALLAAKQASARRTSTAEAEVQIASDRRKRGLGRAASGNSATSSAMSNHAERPNPPARSIVVNDESQSFSQRWYAQHDAPESLRVNDAVKGNVPPATQGLVYGDEETRERKEAVLRMLAGETAGEPSPRKKKPEATLKDVLPANNAGIGARVGRKGKARRM